MPWTAPRTWVVGEVVTAANLNTELRDNMLMTEAALATTAGGIYTKGWGTTLGEMDVRTWVTSSTDIPNVKFGAQENNDYTEGPPFVTVPKAEAYLVSCGARQHRTAGTGQVFFGFGVFRGRGNLNQNIFTNNSDGYRTCNTVFFDATSVPTDNPNLVGDTYTFSMRYGGTVAGTSGHWAQRTLAILPLGRPKV